MRKLFSGVSVEKGLNGTITIAQTGLAAMYTSTQIRFQESAGNYISNLTEEERGRYGGGIEAFFSNEEVTDQDTADQMLSFLTHVLVYNLARTLENPRGNGARIVSIRCSRTNYNDGFERIAFPTRQGQIAQFKLN